MTGFVPPKPVPPKHKLGPVRRFFASLHSSLDTFYEKSYGMKMGDVRLPGRTVFFLNQPELVQKVLVTDAHRFPKSVVMSTILKLLLGEGVFVSNGALWEQQRRMMEPAFKAARIKAIFPLMRDAADAMAERFAEGAAGPDTVIDLEMTHVTADVIFRTLYSRPFTRQQAELIFENFEQFQRKALLQGVLNMSGLPEWLSVGKTRARQHGEAIREQLRIPIHDRLTRIEAGEQVPEQDMLASFIAARDPETGEAFTEIELVDQVATMFLAGHETSASALSWSLYLIASVPEVRQRLQAEADSAFADGPLTFEKLRLLPFTRDVFREALRLYPPLAVVTRDATVREEMRGKQIKPGALMFISPWLLHRHTEHWENPDVFDPDRFSRTETKASEQKAYLPFSRGPRVCMGASFALQEAVIVLATILRDWEITPAGGHVPEPVARLTLRSENGIRLDMRRREKQPFDKLGANG